MDSLCRPVDLGKLGQGAAHLTADIRNFPLMVLKQVHADLFSRDSTFCEAAILSVYTLLAHHYLAGSYQCKGQGGQLQY